MRFLIFLFIFAGMGMAQARVTLKWPPFSKASYYRLIIADDRQLKNKLVDIKTEEPFFRYLKPPQGKIYYQITSYSKDGKVQKISKTTKALIRLDNTKRESVRADLDNIPLRKIKTFKSFKNLWVFDEEDDKSVVESDDLYFKNFGKTNKRPKKIAGKKMRIRKIPLTFRAHEYRQKEIETKVFSKRLVLTPTVKDFSMNVDDEAARNGFDVSSKPYAGVRLDYEYSIHRRGYYRFELETEKPEFSKKTGVNFAGEGKSSISRIGYYALFKRFNRTIWGMGLDFGDHLFISSRNGNSASVKTSKVFTLNGQIQYRLWRGRLTTIHLLSNLGIMSSTKVDGNQTDIAPSLSATFLGDYRINQYFSMVAKAGYKRTYIGGDNFTQDQGDLFFHIGVSYLFDSIKTIRRKVPIKWFPYRRYYDSDREQENWNIWEIRQRNRNRIDLNEDEAGEENKSGIEGY